ncbi:MAG: hypothetical protein Q8N85_06025 [Candidatus Omnitrophota bacterium]|nr:hypothetical protein [Candidatus Omnitrophota bacterium]
MKKFTLTAAILLTYILLFSASTQPLPSKEALSPEARQSQQTPKQPEYVPGEVLVKF